MPEYYSPKCNKKDKLVKSRCECRKTIKIKVKRKKAKVRITVKKKKPKVVKKKKTKRYYPFRKNTRVRYILKVNLWKK